MMKHFDQLLAKSYDAKIYGQTPPTYARLVPHVKAVERAGESIVEVVGALIIQQLNLPLDPWLSRLRRAVKVACVCHDLGKANDGFQKLVRGMIKPTEQPARHELLSALLLMDKEQPIRGWALDLLQTVDLPGDAEMLLDCVIGAVGGHHLKLDEDWKKAVLALRGGCGQLMQTLLTHSDLKPLFYQSICDKEVTYSLIPGEQSFIGNKHIHFNLNSNRWRDRLKKEPEWWRFAAAVKALVAAADVAGSAILPEKQDPRKYVLDTLSRQVSAAQMLGVVQVRLKGKEPRDFQKKIAEKKGRVTLVEAGCGSGKTAAAYMWAAHHADGKKLFFCYPTTGTATEGFLGYVHETNVEADLIHSRAIVDLEGLAESPDEDGESDFEKDHMLRIESLKAWGPQVVICTADTVLALVRNNRRGLYNSPAILSAAFVFDELHAYDNPMFEAVVALIKALPGASFLLMTASLPKARKDFLLKHLQVDEVPPPVELEEIPRYEFRRISKEEAFEKAKAAVKGKKRVLWICNTVVRAQSVLKRLQDEAVAVRTYHSRFKYKDRVRQHRKVVRWFGQEKRRWGVVAVTTQVAEMSLDLDADILISEIAPTPALIQRLGRLNRRVTPENQGSPRTAYFLDWEKPSPYKDETELQLAERWIAELMTSGKSLRQTDLSAQFNLLSTAAELRLDVRTAWLDSGWFAAPELVRDIGHSVSVILPEDERPCRDSAAEIIKRAIPMNYSNVMKDWQEWKNHLLAPKGVIHYDKRTGAILLWKK
jgi:CRISPR-associated endonuclease/helicase Cas3